VDILRDAETPGLRADVLLEHATVLWHAGRADDARRHVREAQALYAAKGHVAGAERARAFEGLIAGAG
jgi:hypothetical protein